MGFWHDYPGSWQIYPAAPDEDPLLEWSAETYHIFGVETGRVLSLNFFLDCVHPDDREMVTAAWQAALAGAPYDIEHRIVTPAGVRWVRERAELEFDQRGQMILGVGTVQDVTVLKAKEVELLASRQMLRELAAHHEQVREEERRRIAGEIHDDLGQHLTSLRMDLSLLAIRFGRENPELQAHVDRMKEAVDATISVTRNVATALRPGALDLGLIPAVDWLVGGFQERTGVKCILDFPAVEELMIDSQRATAIFRILQESLTNVARHAHASEVHVRIALHDNEVLLQVSDNGHGFDPAEVRSRRTFGLMGMRERAVMFGGISRVEQRPEGGTVVSIRMPMNDGARS